LLAAKSDLSDKLARDEQVFDCFVRRGRGHVPVARPAALGSTIMAAAPLTRAANENE
jgi:fumarate hydratase class II